VIHALATGAGKDATLALHRARARGLDVTVGFNVFEESTGRVRFHGTRAALVERHLEALGLEPLLARSEPDDFEGVFSGVLAGLAERGVGGVVFGNVHLEGVRAWYEERVRGVGLEHVEPLWGEEPGALVREVVDEGYRAVVVSVDLERGDPAWLGRTLDHELVDEIEAAGADPCGEHGEYHTFVRDGPEFVAPVRLRAGRTVETEGHRLLDLLPAEAADAASESLSDPEDP